MILNDETGVRAALGQVVLAGIVQGRTHADQMLVELKMLAPRHVRAMQDVALASTLHDFYFDGVTLALGEDPRVQIVRSKSSGDHIVVDDEYVIRFKKHDAYGRVQSLGTKAARDFHSGSVVLEGCELVSLTAGYIFDEDLREMGPAVLSYRTAIRSVPEWCYEISEASSGVTGITFNPIVSPQLPIIETTPVRREAEGAEGQP